MIYFFRLVFLLLQFVTFASKTNTTVSGSRGWDFDIIEKVKITEYRTFLYFESCNSYVFVALCF